MYAAEMHRTRLFRGFRGSARHCIINERRRPREDNMPHVEECAGRILRLLEPNDVYRRKVAIGLYSFREYLSIHRERLAFDLEYTGKFVEPGERVLEIGACPFMLTLPLIRRGFDVTAVDKPTSEWDATIPVRLGVKHVGCDLDTQELPFETNCFDVVLMNQVFAHLRMNLIRSMREVLRVLRPGGLLILSSPNLRSFRALAQLIVRGDACAFMGSIYYNFSFLDSFGVMGQIRVYTPKEIEDFLAAMGCTIGPIIYRGRAQVGRLARIANVASYLCPSFRPDFTLLAMKPAEPQTTRASRGGFGRHEATALSSVTVGG